VAKDYDLSWIMRKNHYVNRLLKEKKEGRVDEDIVPLLELINSLNAYYTTSSCSGRIQIAETEIPGEKGVMRVVAKWHRPITAEELKATVEASEARNLWLGVQPPILHIMCRSIDAALEMLVIARGSGFKRAGIQGIKEGRCPVEIIGTERIEMPLTLDGKLIVEYEKYPLLVEKVNRVLLKSKERIRRLENALKQRFNVNSATL